MIIISHDGRLMVRSRYITKIEATTKGKVVAWTEGNATLQADAYLGGYDNDIQAGIALNMLIDAIATDDLECDVQWHMPTGDEPFMQVDTTVRGGGFSERKGRTTGKTK